MPRRLLGGICGLLALLAVCVACQAYQVAIPPVTAASDPLPTQNPGYTESPSKPPTTSIDELIVKLEAIKAKKEAIEREEKETRAMLKERVKAQRERLEKLGVTDPVQPTPPAPVVVPSVPGLPTVTPTHGNTTAIPSTYSVPPTAPLPR